MPSHYLNQCWSIVNANLRNSSEILIEIFTHKNAFEIVVCEMAVVLSLPQCVKFGVILFSGLSMISNHLTKSHGISSVKGMKLVEGLG